MLCTVWDAYNLLQLSKSRNCLPGLTWVGLERREAFVQVRSESKHFHSGWGNVSVVVHSPARTTYKPSELLRGSTIILPCLLEALSKQDTHSYPTPYLLPNTNLLEVIYIFPHVKARLSASSHLLLGFLRFCFSTTGLRIMCSACPVCTSLSSPTPVPKKDLVKALMFTEPLLREWCGRWKSVKEINVYIKSS